MMNNKHINIHSHFIHNSEIEIISLDSNELNTVNTFFSYGIHPANALLTVVHEESLSNHPNCLAIGECGLDKVISIPMDIQLNAFEAQILLSERLQLPLILHCVKAWNEVVQIKRKLNPQQPWIFHGFRKTALLENVLNEGLMISIGTAVLYDNKLQEIIPLIPEDKLFLETDNDPNHSIGEIYAKVAALRKVSVENLEERIYTNFRKTFPKFEPFP